MLTSFRKSDEGVGLAMALSIAFIVFALAAVWLSLSFHELDEVSYNEHRTAALNSAEAGARWAMSALAGDRVGAGWVGVDSSTNATTDISGVGLRTALETADYVAAGTGGSGLGGTCAMTPHNVSAAGDQTGEWWVRVWTVDAASYKYQIESWGWSPQTDHRQAANQKVTVQVELIPEFDGFTNAIFAEANLSGLNRKEIYGDVYAGDSASISNFTRIYPNDAGYIGAGRLRVHGDLVLGSGSNNEFSGPVHVQGVLRDDTPGSLFSELFIRNDETAEAATNYGGFSHFDAATVTEEAKFDSQWGGSGYTGSITGVVTNPVNDMDEVPEIGLPGFTWNPSDYTSEGYTVSVWATAAAFQTWFTANRGALSGVHLVQEATDIDFTSSTLAGDFMVVVEGDVEVRKTPSTAPSPDPIDLIVVQSTTSGRLTTSNGVSGADGILHMLLFSNGEFDAANQTTVFGAVYALEDVSTNRLEVHFRPPEDSLVKGFDFTIPLPDSFIPQPLVWRSVAVAEPTPITDYCGVPGGAAAAVPPPSPTSTTSTSTTVVSSSTTVVGSTTTTVPVTTTSIVTCTTLPNGKCKNK